MPVSNIRLAGIVLCLVCIELPHPSSAVTQWRADPERIIFGLINNIKKCDLKRFNTSLAAIEKCKTNLKLKLNTRDRAGLTALHYACEKGCLKIVESLVEHGAEINIEQVRQGENTGYYPLHAALGHGNAAIARFLIDHGADIKATTCNGLTTLDYAISGNKCGCNDELIALLKQQGIKTKENL